MNAKKISFHIWYWLSRNVVSFKTEVGFARNLKNVTVFTRKIHISQDAAVGRRYETSWQGYT